MQYKAMNKLETWALLFFFLIFTMKLLTIYALIPLVLVLAQKDPVQEAIVISAGTQETTQFGTKINNTDSLTAGERGPTLLEDFMLREKVMHFGNLFLHEKQNLCFFFIY